MEQNVNKTTFFFPSINKQKQNQIQTNVAEVHAFIVVIISSSADCKTERTIVHEKHSSPEENPSYIFTVSGIIYILYITFILVYDSFLDL